ncbi:MAG TPA: SCO family protein [Blastocatellia bacterium]|nr:SCO family protein [Blastocatellia bacterium]
MKRSLRTNQVMRFLVVVFLVSSAGRGVIGSPNRKPTQGARTVYTCPMHPEILSEAAGRCPRCGMELRVADQSVVGLGLAESATRPDGTIAGLSIPDVPVVDQNGRRLRFFTDLVKGRTVAINFMFTTCTTICPPLAVTFAKVQQQLNSAVGDGILLISVTVDPVTDVPARMKSYLLKFGAQPGWLFVGGAKPDIDKLLRALGAYVTDKNDHTPMIVIGNERAGYWTRAFGLASAGKLANLVVEASHKPAEQR